MANSNRVVPRVERMANCTIVHFVSATWDDLTPWFDQRAARVEPRRWNFPEPLDPLLFVEAYEDHRAEFEPEDLGRLRQLLGGELSCAVGLQLRSVKGNHSCEAAIDLTRRLLREFSGVADDTFAEDYWTLAEIEAGVVKPYGRFLDYYRQGFQECD